MNRFQAMVAIVKLVPPPKRAGAATLALSILGVPAFAGLAVAVATIARHW